MKNKPISRVDFYQIYYTTIANYYNTDVEGAKRILEKYIIELKKDVDNSNDDNDEKLKTLWKEGF